MNRRIRIKQRNKFNCILCKTKLNNSKSLKKHIKSYDHKENKFITTLSEDKKAIYKEVQEICNKKNIKVKLIFFSNFDQMQKSKLIKKSNKDKLYLAFKTSSNINLFRDLNDLSMYDFNIPSNKIDYFISYEGRCILGIFYNNNDLIRCVNNIIQENKICCICQENINNLLEENGNYKVLKGCAVCNSFICDDCCDEYIKNYNYDDNDDFKLFVKCPVCRTELILR